MDNVGALDPEENWLTPLQQPSAANSSLAGVGLCDLTHPMWNSYWLDLLQVSCRQPQPLCAPEATGLVSNGRYGFMAVPPQLLPLTVFQPPVLWCSRIWGTNEMSSWWPGTPQSITALWQVVAAGEFPYNWYPVPGEAEPKFLIRMSALKKITIWIGFCFCQND